MIRFSIVSLSYLSIVFLVISCAAQKETIKHRFETINLEEYYDGKGAIVPASSDVGILALPYGRINLTVEQVERAESILIERIGAYNKKLVGEGKAYFPSWVKTRGDTIDS